MVISLENEEDLVEKVASIIATNSGGKKWPDWDDPKQYKEDQKNFWRILAKKVLCEVGSWRMVK